jgi:hypothetical protein
VISSRDIADLERDELVAAFREVFSASGELDRDTAIREVARALGFNRTGSRINFRIRYMFSIATKRRIIRNTGAAWTIDCRAINDYARDDLIEALLNAMGRPWVEREDAIRAAARHLGFRRTGSQIRDAFKSAINGAIRRGLLKYDGDYLRRNK